MARYGIKYIFLALLLIGSSALYAFIHHREFTYCNDGVKQHLERRIKLNGYYLGKVKDQVYPVYFYEDGTYAACRSVKDKADVGRLFTTEKDWGKRQGKMLIYGREWVRWGRYILSGDTIKTQSFYTYAVQSSRVQQSWYLVKNDSTITIIKNIAFGKYGEENDILTTNPEYQNFHFVQDSKKPDSVSWLNERKWYKCN